MAPITRRQISRADTDSMDTPPVISGYSDTMVESLINGYILPLQKKIIAAQVTDDSVAEIKLKVDELCREVRSLTHHVVEFNKHQLRISLCVTIMSGVAIFGVILLGLVLFVQKMRANGYFHF